MGTIQKRAEKIASAMMAEAEAESRKIVEEANCLSDLEVKSVQTLSEQHAYELMQAKINHMNQEKNQKIAQHELEASRKLLLRRQEMEKSVMAAVRIRLHEFTASAEYLPFLQEQLKKAFALLPTEDCILYLRSEDLPLQAQLLDGLAPCTVEADSSFQLGGFVLYSPSKKIRVDETLDSSLQENRRWFLENSGLRVQ